MAQQHQAFNEFLNQGGPSTPRGRGRGGGGRGRGSGRGGRGGGPSSGGSNLKKSDYSNVPFDYASVNSQRYNKMDGFVQPFGPTDTPSSRGSPFPRGRGRGRGGPGASTTANASPKVASGQSTPVRGVGHRGRGGHGGLGSDRPSSGYKGKSTVGREGVTWGGRGAPLFVKGGELFKDGEVDIVRKDESESWHLKPRMRLTVDDEITIETVPLSDPSAPQMLNLEDDTEIEIMNLDSTEDQAEPAETAQQHDAITLTSDAEASHTSPTPLQVDIDMSEEEPLIQPDVPPPAPDAAPSPVETEPTETIQVAQVQIELPQRSLPPSSQAAEEELDSLFFVDTAPALVEEDPFYVDVQPGQASSPPSKPKYHTSSRQALGHREAAASSDEEIVFVSKSYGQPQPIQVDMPKASGSRPARSLIPETKRAAAPPPKISRSRKKATKKEKKKSGKKSKRAKRQAEFVDGSDIEWGSDGPPRGAQILGMEGVEESEGDDDDDVAVLRDYLEGTLLNAKTGSSDEMDDDQEMDDDEVDDAIEIDMMKRFGASVSQWNDDASIGSGSGDDDSEDDDSHMGEMEGESESDSDDDSEDGIDVDALELDAKAEEDIDRQLALALEKGEEDSDIEELFTGKSGWADETDWFLQSMTDALDPKAVSYKNRKSNSKLFHAIENGNFDDFDLPAEPTKKNKNKHIPAELQVQWNKDREAKAEKKRQRALDRLMAELDPHPASGKRKNKGKGKDIAHAASIAHLIPASATEVAEMFDISSGEDADAPGIWRNKRQGGLLPDITETWMSEVNGQVQAFLQDAGKTTFSLPPMAKDGRMKIHMLAECYGLVSKSKGGGRGRFTVLIKNKRSGQIVDYAKIDRLVKASQAPGGLFFKNFFGGKKGNGKPNKFASSAQGKRTTTAKGNGNMPSLRARDGEEVGGGADRIGMDNVGHRLLSKMGWADGDRIGRSGGLEAPIMAIVKNTKSGLGA